MRAPGVRLATRRRSARPRTGYASPPVRALPSLLRQLAGDRLAMMTAAAGYGDAVRLPMGPKTLYFFNHPDHAKHVLADNAANYHKGIGLVQARRALGDGLLTSEGELWRRQRKVVQPAFQHKRIAGQADAVAQEAAALVARLRARAGHGPVRLDQELTGLTLGVLGRTLLASDLGGFDGLGHAFEAVQDQAMFEMVTMNAVPTWVPLPGQLRFRHARARLQHVVERLTEAGHPKGADAGDGTDALSRLIASVGEETDASTGRRRLRDELITLLLAGHETTASTLGWTCYLIDRHPEIRERLHEEAVEVLGDRLPSYEDLQRLPFTTATVEEVMRLYPPVWILPRQAQADDEIGGLRRPGRGRRPGLPVHAAPSPPLLGGAGAVPPRAVPAGCPGRPPPVRAHPLRGGAAGLRGEQPGAHGGGLHGGAALPRAAPGEGAGSPGGGAADALAGHEGRAARDGPPRAVTACGGAAGPAAPPRHPAARTMSVSNAFDRTRCRATRMGGSRTRISRSRNAVGLTGASCRISSGPREPT
ncbi:Cytochrome P450 [Streptomyces sp. DfronAA-171]|nr:Cytochrome P450 [Streptomyces sp. DfronAA-171]